MSTFRSIHLSPPSSSSSRSSLRFLTEFVSLTQIPEWSLSLVQYVIYALGKDHMRFIQSLRSFTQRSQYSSDWRWPSLVPRNMILHPVRRQKWFKCWVEFSSRCYLCARKRPYALHPVSQKFHPTFPIFVWLTMALSRPSKEDRLAFPLSTASLLQAIVGVMFLALCPQAVSRVPQHFRPSEKQDACEGCFPSRFPRQCICSVISLHSGMSRAVHPQECWAPAKCR